MIFDSMLLYEILMYYVKYVYNLYYDNFDSLFYVKNMYDICALSIC